MSDVANPSAQDTPKAEETETKATAQAAPVAEAKKAPAPEAAKVEAQTDTPKPQDAQAPKTVVPEKYDLKLPENSLLDASHTEKIAAYAKAQGLSNDAAQALLNREATVVADYAEGLKEKQKQKSSEWVDQVKGDTELGGEGFARNSELAKRVINRYGSDALKKELNETGLGNHPELVRFVSRIGKSMSEDQLILPGKNAGGVSKSMEDVFYGNQNK